MRIYAIMLITALLAGSAQAAMTQEAALEKAKKMVQELGSGLKQELEAAVKKSGFGGAVAACGQIAQAKASQVSQANGAQIHRISLKLRNLANAPDEFEKKTLEEMEKDLADGALKEAYAQPAGEKDGKKVLRFLKPIVTTPFCLNCHGDESKINAEAALALKKLYPEDKAKGYGENQIRGAFSVMVPLD